MATERPRQADRRSRSTAPACAAPRFGIEHEVDTRSVGFGVWMYRVTRGRVVRLWRRRAIVLTTTGRRSGRPRTVLVQVFADGPDLLVVAANSGLPRPPGWYFNPA